MSCSTRIPTARIAGLALASTANLLLLNPTRNAALFLRFVRAYLEKALSGSEVTRWIDQFALLQARHHLALRQTGARIGMFDTAADINNVMYTSYREHPFRFLSLYHGFDMTSLPGKPRVPSPRRPKPARGANQGVAARKPHRANARQAAPVREPQKITDNDRSRKGFQP